MKTLPPERAKVRGSVCGCAGERPTLGTLLDEDLVSPIGVPARRGRSVDTPRAFDR